jgi:two-component system response regulator HydG
MKPTSFKNSLLLVVTLLVLTNGLFITQIVTHRYSISLIKGAVARAESIAHSLSMDVADKILLNDRVAVHTMLEDQVFSTPDVAYIFIIRNGNILSHTFSGNVPVQLISANEAKREDAGHLEKLVSEKGEHFLDIAWPIFGGNAGTLRLGLSEETYRSEVKRLWWQMNMITLAVLLFALLASQWFIQRLTRPLVQLAEAAEKIDEGNLDAQIQIQGRAEVVKLASSFNQMLTRLHEHAKKLQETQCSMELQHSELERAHQRVTTALSISREISALPNLSEVSSYLIRSLGAVVECRNLTLMVYSDKNADIL